jgi:hypothetical protein
MSFVPHQEEMETKGETDKVEVGATTYRMTHGLLQKLENCCAVKRGVAESHSGGHVAPRDIVTMEKEKVYNMTENTIGLNCIGFDDGMVHSGILSFCTVSIAQYSVEIQ